MAEFEILQLQESQNQPGVQILERDRSSRAYVAPVPQTIYVIVTHVDYRTILEETADRKYLVEWHMIKEGTSPEQIRHRVFYTDLTSRGRDVLGTRMILYKSGLKSQEAYDWEQAFHYLASRLPDFYKLLSPDGNYTEATLQALARTRARAHASNFAQTPFSEAQLFVAYFLIEQGHYSPESIPDEFKEIMAMEAS